MASPLDRLRVLDIGTLFPAPLCAAMLGDLGADVIKIEPPGGDGLRSMGAGVDGHSLGWAVVGRNKRSITLDLSKERGQALLHRLVERADLVVENLPERSLERWHCTYAELAARNPRLVVVSLSCFGRSGPYAERAGNGTLAEAFGGLTHMTGERDGPPLLTSLPIGDVLAAIFGVLGALAACYQRDARGGSGQRVDVSMYEPILQFLTSGVPLCARTGEAQRRSGSRIPGAVPRNTYRTRDGRWLAISAVTDGIVWERLCRALDRPDLAADPRFATKDQRRAHAEALAAILDAAFAAHDWAHWRPLLRAHEVTFGVIERLQELPTDEQARHAGIIAETTATDVPRTVNNPVRLGFARPRPAGPPPAVGQHTELVLREAGLSDADIAALRARGAAD